MSSPTLFAAVAASAKSVGTLSRVDGRGGWWPVIRESFTGAWQQNVVVSSESALAYFAVYACITLIAQEIAKCRLKLVEQDKDGIWDETDSPHYSPVIRKPNHFQNRIQFYEWWLTSKLSHGNMYALKVRNRNTVVEKLYILDPQRVTPLVAPDGSVFYELKSDNLAGLEKEAYIVPAREIIHDLMNPLFHPLVGVSPLFAAALAAIQGLKIQNSSAKFFANGAQPGGVLTAPGEIKQATADRVKEYWETNFSGDNTGKVAVLGDGLKYEPMMMKAIDAQLIDQLKWTAIIVCSVFHVPPYMIGITDPPNYNNIQALNQQFYSQCLQVLMESIELCLDEGLELAPERINGKRYGTEFELDDLLKMDSITMMETLDKGKNLITPNEGRKRLNLKPVTGGHTVYRQQQDFSLEALNRRDEMAPAPSPTLPGTSSSDTKRASVGDHVESQRSTPCHVCNDVGLLPERAMSDPQGQLPCPHCSAGAAMATYLASRSDSSKEAEKALLSVKVLHRMRQKRAA